MFDCLFCFFTSVSPVALTRFLFQLSFLTSNVYTLTCCVFLLTHVCVCVCTHVPLSSLQYWQLLSPKLPCSLCFISSSLLDLLSTSLLCSQLLSTPTKVRPLCCFSPSAVTYWFSSSLEGFCSLCPCFTVCITLGVFFRLTTAMWGEKKHKTWSHVLG